jgi:HPt (histidine-containing phosphotransfer) domain-containing protein
MVQGTAKPTVRSPANDLLEQQLGSSACGHGAGEARRDGESIIDLTHLARMTMGEKHLEAEVLALFDRQAGMLLARMKGASPKAAAALAHTLAGSARGIGAWEVARAAQEVELAAQGSLRAETASAVRALGRVVARAQAAIKELLGTT